MKKLFYLTATVVLMNCYLCAQQLEKGYIIKLNNEKIEGYLSERTDDELRNHVVFSIAKDSPRVDYNVNELQSFAFTYGRTFERFLLKIFNGKDSVETPVFAKRIWTGKIDVYTVQFDLNRVEYILKNNFTNEWVLLKRPVDETLTVNGTTVVKKDIKYLQQLTAIKKDSVSTYVEQKDVNYSKYGILNNIKSYDSKYADRYPTKYYVEKRLKLYGAGSGSEIVNSKRIHNAFRVNIFRDFMLIERSERIAFHQGISYIQYDEYGKPENNARIFNFSLLGIKLQADPMFACPFFNFGFGITYKKLPIYSLSTSETSFASEKEIKYSIQAAAGVKFRLVSKLYLLTSCSFENSIFCLNAGIAFYHSKKTNSLD